MIEHLIYDKHLPQPAPDGVLYYYGWAQNGVFLHAERDCLHVVFQLAQFETRGLKIRVEPYFDFKLPVIPLNLVEQMLAEFALAAQGGLEKLAWFSHSELNIYDRGWSLTFPEQQQTATNCRPVDGQEDQYERVIVEVHSHHTMHARFSRTDNEDEQGFRVYAVWGRYPRKPELRVRVGVYGQFGEVPADWVFEMPEGLRDCHSSEM